MHNHQGTSAGEQHVNKVPGLTVPQLTLQQAIIIQGYTGIELLTNPKPSQGDIQMRLQRSGTPYTSTPDLYQEDFDRMCQVHQNEWGVHPPAPDLAKQILDVIYLKMHNDPFAMWDTRVDVLLEGHLDDWLKEHISLTLGQMQATVSYTERPGDTNQTWIVINRPDPYQATMTTTIGLVERATAHYGPDQVNKITTVTIPTHIPKRHITEFATMLQAMWGVGDVLVEYERFHRDQAKITMMPATAVGPGK